MGAAILSDHYLYTSQARYPIGELTAPAAIVRKCADLGITDLFLSGTHLQTATRREPWQEEVQGGGGFWSLRGPENDLSAKLGLSYLHNAATSDWLPSGFSASVKAILTDLDALAAALKVKSLGYSPQWRGIACLAITRQQHPAWFVGPKPKNPNHDAAPNFSIPIPWSSVGYCLHTYDKNADYLACARTTPLGIGEPRYTREFQPRRAGVWDVQAAKSLATSYHCPIRESGHYDTATVRAALDRNTDVRVLGGWYYPESPTVLRAWAERVAAARQAVLDSTALPPLKALYTQSLGALAAERADRQWTYRPHWWYAVLAESARRMHMLLAATPEIYACATDRIAVVTQERNPYIALPGCTPTNQDAPGRFRYLGSQIVSRETCRQSKNVRNGAELFDWLDDRNSWENWGEEGLL